MAPPEPQVRRAGKPRDENITTFKVRLCNSESQQVSRSHQLTMPWSYYTTPFLASHLLLHVRCPPPKPQVQRAGQVNHRAVRLSQPPLSDHTVREIDRCMEHELAMLYIYRAAPFQVTSSLPLCPLSVVRSRLSSTPVSTQLCAAFRMPISSLRRCCRTGAMRYGSIKPVGARQYAACPPPPDSTATYLRPKG